MDIDKIRNKLRAHKLNGGGTYHYYAVLIPLVEVEGDQHLLYEVRSENLKSQPGEVCFPGGRMEIDENPMNTAIRETCEELGIQPDQIEIMEEIKPIITPFNVVIYVFVGRLKINSIEDLPFNPDEVKEVFTVPVAYLYDNEPEKYTVESVFNFPEDFPFHKIHNGKSYNWRNGSYDILFYEYDQRTIWGMTAKMTRNLMKILKLC